MVHLLRTDKTRESSLSDGFVFDINEGATDDPIKWKLYNWGTSRLHDIEVKEERKE